ncbi:hypothetical protein BH18ACT5_BH18ACT5_12180 [soil metagenome]
MKCLILAGGTGSRLSAKEPSKPLAVVAGLTLVERTIVAAHAAGADAFYIVCGHNASRLVAHLDDVARRRSLVVHPILNLDFRQGNGLSALCAREHLQGERRFGLLMADHVFEPAMLSLLFNEEPDPDGVVLAIDRDTSNPLVDLNDVTRVSVSDGLVRIIGKGLEDYDGYDTGAFIATPAIFDALDEARASGDTSLSGGMQRLASASRLRAHDATGRMWIDVDTRSDLRKASRRLYAGLRKPHDGIVSRLLNRPVSLRLFTPALLRAYRGITANQVSVLAFIVAAGAGLIFAVGWPAAAGLLVHISSVLDGSDGEVARLKLQNSDFGDYLDAVLDRFGDSIMLLGATAYLVGSSSLRQVLGNAWDPLLVMVAGVAAVNGTLLVSYTSTKAAATVGHVYVGPLIGAGRGRDLRLFVLALAGGLASIHPLFLWGGITFIAVMTHLIVMRRMWWSRSAANAHRPTDLGSVRNIVFDFDGTLADTMGVLSDAAVDLLVEMYDMAPNVARRAYRATSGMAFASQMEQILPGDPRNFEVVQRFEALKPALIDGCSLFPGTLQTIERLKRLEIAVFVCSSTTADIVQRFCKRTGLAELVDRVYGLKPGLTKLAQLQKVLTATTANRNQIMFVGDSIHDAELAQSTGIRFAGVTHLFTEEEFARAGEPSVTGLPQLAALADAAYARRSLLSSIIAPRSASGQVGTVLLPDQPIVETVDTSRSHGTILNSELPPDRGRRV